MIQDIFGPGSNPGHRKIETPERAAEIVKSLKIAQPNLKVVLTQGTYDILHIGHARYLEAAKRLGDLLIVGLDSDEKTRERKEARDLLAKVKEEILTNLQAVEDFLESPVESNGEKKIAAGAELEVVEAGPGNGR